MENKKSGVDYRRVLRRLPRWLALGLVVFLAGVVIKINLLDREKKPLPGLFLTFSAQSSAPSRSLVFFNGSQQLEFDLIKSDSFLPYSIPIPNFVFNMLLFSIGWEPLRSPGTLAIKEMRIGDAEGRLLKTISSNEVEFLNQPANVGWKDNVLLIEKRNQEERPVFIFKNIFPIRSAVDNYPRVTTLGVTVVWLLGWALIGLILWRMGLVIGQSPAPIRLVILGSGLVIFGLRLWCLDHFGFSSHHWDSWEREAYDLYLPFMDGNLSWKSLFQPCNEHRIFFTRVQSLGLFLLNGQWDNLYEALVNAFMYALIMTGLGIILWRLAGQKLTGWIFGAVVIIGALPFTWENLVWGFQSQFYFFIGFSVLTLWLLGLHPPFTTRWYLGIAAALSALFCVGSGSAALCAAGAMVLWKWIRKPSAWREVLPTLIVCALIFAFYSFWFAVPEHNYGMLSKNMTQFFTTLAKTMSFPFVNSCWPAVLMWLPFPIVMIQAFRQRREVTNWELFLAGLGALCIVNNLGIAYFRGGFCSVGSRYFEIIALGMALNGLAVVWGIYEWGRLKKRILARGWLYFCFLWWVIIMAGTVSLTDNVLARDAVARNRRNERAEQVIKYFLRDDRTSIMLGRREKELPHPDPLAMATFLREPRIRSFLPSSIRDPVRIKPVVITGFVPFGLEPNYAPDPDADINWGSFGNKGRETASVFQSDILPPRRYSWLEFKVIGLNINSALQHLDVVKVNPRRVHHVFPGKNTPGEWKTAAAFCPGGPVRIEAAEFDPTSNLAFCEPREKSFLSWLSAIIVGYWNWFLFAGLMLISLACAMTFRAFSDRQTHMES